MAPLLKQTGPSERDGSEETNERKRVSKKGGLLGQEMPRIAVGDNGKQFTYCSLKPPTPQVPALPLLVPNSTHIASPALISAVSPRVNDLPYLLQLFHSRTLAIWPPGISTPAGT